VALDFDHGIHVLNLETGQQSRYRNSSSAAVAFAFCADEPAIHVVTADKVIRRVGLESGAEESVATIELPAPTKIVNREGSFPKLNFAMATGTGACAMCEGNRVTIFSLKPDVPPTEGGATYGIGDIVNLCRIQTSDDGNSIGLGYGFGVAELGISDSGAIWRFDVLDRSTGRIARRIIQERYLDVDDKFAQTSGLKVTERRILVKGHFAACLRRDGSTVHAECFPWR
jgi:hypothetical protein